MSNELGKMIRVLRRQQNMTQGALADRIGLSRTSVVNIEAGNQTLTEHTINAIANALGYRLLIKFKKIAPASEDQQDVFE